MNSKRKIVINCSAGLFLFAGTGSTIRNLKVDGEINLLHASSNVILDTIGVEILRSLLPEDISEYDFNRYKAAYLTTDYINTFLGGIVCSAKGTEENPAALENCTSSVAFKIGTVNGQSAAGVYYGGIAAATTHAELKNSKFDGSFTADTVAGSCYGGLVGQPGYTIIDKCESAGSFTAKPLSVVYIGGIAGVGTDLTITNSLFSGKLNADGNPKTTYVAGLTAGAHMPDVPDENVALTIENSLVMGDVGTGYAFVQESAVTTTITNSYAVGASGDKLTGTLPTDAALTDVKSVTADEAKTEAFADKLNAGQTPRVWSPMTDGTPVLKSYIPFYTVIFDANGGTAEIESDRTNRYSKLDALPKATMSGRYRFGGWYLSDGTEVTLDTEFTENTTATAKWIHKGSTAAYYTLTFNTNGGSAISSITRTNYATIDLTLPDYVPTREGYKFAGWYSDKELTNEITSVYLTVDKDIYAKWTAISSIDNFESTGTYSGYLDVDESKWYGTQREGVVRDVTRLGIMAGDGNGYFRPDDRIRLSEAVKMAATVYSIYSGDGHVFDQSAGASWYDCYADYAIENGIIKADDFTDYAREATRAEMAYIFAHSLPQSELTRISGLVPPDVSSGAEYSAEVLTLYAAGVLLGNDEIGTFSGERSITRAEAAAIITRIALPGSRISH